MMRTLEEIEKAAAVLNLHRQLTGGSHFNLTIAAMLWIVRPVSESGVMFDEMLGEIKGRNAELAEFLKDVNI